MNISTGHLIALAEFSKLEETNPTESKKYIPVVRDLTAKESGDMQIRLYSPCACGSGKKFKFCCHKK